MKIDQPYVEHELLRGGPVPRDERVLRAARVAVEGEREHRQRETRQHAAVDREHGAARPRVQARQHEQRHAHRDQRHARVLDGTVLLAVQQRAGEHDGNHLAGLGERDGREVDEVEGPVRARHAAQVRQRRRHVQPLRHRTRPRLAAHHCERSARGDCINSSVVIAP